MDNIKRNGGYATIEEATAALNQKFLNRQVKLNPRNNEESLNLIVNTIKESKDQPLQIIASPGVDVMGNAYFFIGLRIDRQEIDLKLTVNEAVIALILAFLCGAEELPNVKDLTPKKVSEEDKIAWYEELEKLCLTHKAVRKETVELTETGSYLKVTYRFAHGKITVKHGKVENLMQLLTA